MNEQVTVTLTLNDEEAEALAMLATRVGYSELFNFSSCSGEAFAMVLAMAKIRQSLSEVSFYLR